MKLVSIVGTRKSGKTTTTEALIRVLKKRGYTVATVKTINCPMFSMEEKKESNTLRHKNAGADLVCASAAKETAFIYGRGLSQNEIFQKMQADYVLLEGDYASDVPRIICAHTIKEVEERMNPYTVLIAGRIADEMDAVGGVPAISAATDAESLADFVITHINDTTLPVTLSEIPVEAKYFCQHLCKKNCSDNKVLHLPHRQVRHIFLTGEKQVGKTTILNHITEALKEHITGFYTKPFMIGEQRAGHYMHACNIESEEFCNDIPVCIRIKKQGMYPITEAFDSFGVQLLQSSRGQEHRQIILMDELGKMENQALKFQEEVIRCLNSDKIVLGTLQKASTEFLEQIKARKDVKVYTITPENRDEMKAVIMQEVSRLLEGG